MINMKAAGYALSRMFLPSLTALALLFMITLDFGIMIDFLKKREIWSIITRLTIVAGEVAWFYYLYMKSLDRQMLDIDSLDEIRFPDKPLDSYYSGREFSDYNYFYKRIGDYLIFKEVRK